ncbi:histidine phosphatase family protein [Brachybacterium saurashtrense]|uniref:Histidine phosphatase family protein n=1 Tax=Brachybacterium saurashtrense TaxID=556288 RepID=A0A345YPJ0_9MICO|nr:histidine phosphatase family protein [Brachybacterium saurashtrense]AXK45842.1 histidine phosphatase family protein [Brachybacterium saurashtrense]RRR24861.1 histidine phosphatase family protein [Brachybacterium saurashtrense]
MSTTTVHLVRHGEVRNPERILYGRLPGYRLTERGEQMAALVGDHLAAADVALVRSSPLLRAQQTAAPIAAPHGLEVTADQRLIESGNRFEGQRMGHGDARLSDPRNWRWFLDPFRPSWGEPYREQVARVVSAVQDAREQAEGREAVLVLHQLPIWVTRRSAEGKPLWHDPRRRQCGLCSVTSLRFVGPHLAGVDYAEPAAALYDGAVDATGGRLT